MMPYQVRGARLILRLSQRELSEKLDVHISTINTWENVRGAINTSAALAIRFLLTEKGMYSHYRMTYMKKKKIPGLEPEHKRVGCRIAKKRQVIIDALAFKYDR